MNVKKRQIIQLYLFGNKNLINKISKKIIESYLKKFTKKLH